MGRHHSKTEERKGVQAVIEKTRKKFEEVYIIIQNETLLR